MTVFLYILLSYVGFRILLAVFRGFRKATASIAAENSAPNPTLVVQAVTTAMQATGYPETLELGPSWQSLYGLTAAAQRSRFEIRSDLGVVAAAFSADGARVLTGIDGGGLRLWDLATRSALLTVEGGMGFTNNIVSAVALSHDGTQMLSGTWGGVVKVWSAQDGQPLLTLDGHKARITAVAFSPDDSQVLSAANDGTARLWSTKSGQLLHTLPGHSTSRLASGFAVAAAFSPDGLRVLTLDLEGVARLWDAKSGQLLWQKNGHRGMRQAIHFGTDKMQVITAGLRSVEVWDAETSQVSLQQNQPSGPHLACALAPDLSRIMMGGQNGRAELRDAHSGKLLLQLGGHGRGSGLTIMRFSPDGQQVLTCDDDGHASVHTITPKALYEHGDALLRDYQAQLAKTALAVEAAPAPAGQPSKDAPASQGS